MSAKLVLFTSSVFLPLVALLLAALTPPVHAATAGELLEKAIYTEETVGDLDEAIKLYEEVIAEGKAAQSAAAKAQFRLGLIYKKQGKPDQAMAAFKAVVESYPDEAELVAQARKHLPSELELLPAPWGAQGDEMQLNMNLPSGIDIGTMIYVIEPAKHEGKEVWRCLTRGLITANGTNSFSTVLCDKETFAPLKSRWDHGLIGAASATYEGDRVHVKFANKDETKTIKITPPSFDNEQAVQLFRRLPLKEGYKTTVRVMSILGAGEIPLGLEVSAKETLDVPAGKFECYKLELNIGQTFWISTDEHRYVVRFAAGGVTANLVRAEPNQDQAEVKAEAKELRRAGYSLMLPGSWWVYAPTNEKKGERSTIHLLGPPAVKHSQITAGLRTTLKEDEQASAEAWTRSALKDLEKHLKDFKLRDPGIQEIEVASGKAAYIVADYTDGEEPMTLFGIATFGRQWAVNVRFNIERDRFDRLKGSIGEFVKTLNVE